MLFPLHGSDHLLGDINQKRQDKKSTNHNVPSTSNTIPFRGGASDFALSSGFNGANLRCRSEYPGAEDIVRTRDADILLEGFSMDKRRWDLYERRIGLVRLTDCNLQEEYRWSS